MDEADCAGAGSASACRDHSYSPDSCVHGTHVAGTMVSTNYGVAPRARLLAVQALTGSSGHPDPNAECSGSTADIAAGIDFALGHGARVINLSVGDLVPLIFQDPSITGAIDRAASAGVLVVVAAGNSAVPITDSYGSSALMVAATGPSGQIASYSNFGGSVSIAAPGGDSGNATCSTADCVLSTFPDRQYGLLEGTSMAAPHVSGVAALLFSQNPERGRQNVMSTLESTATPLAGAGSGSLNAGAALEVEGRSHPPSSPSTPPVTAGTVGTVGGGTQVATPTAKAPPARPPTAPAGIGPPPSTGTGSRAVIVQPGRPTPAAQGSSVNTPPTKTSAATRDAAGLLRSGPAVLPKHGPAGWAGRHALLLTTAVVLLAVDAVAVVVGRRRLRH